MNEWTKRDGATMAIGDVAIPSGASWERRQPSGKAELIGDVLVPMLQATVTGIVGAMVGGLVGGHLGAAAIGGAVSFGLSWLVLLVDHRAALWAIETVAGQDIDGDQVVGNPDPEPVSTVRVELAQRHPGGQRLRFVDLPIDDDKLSDVALAVLRNGSPFSRDGLSSVLSQTEYRRLSGAMVEAGLLHDLPGNRRELSASGRALLRRLVVVGR